MAAKRRNTEGAEQEEDQALARWVGERCFDFLRPFLKELDEKIDVRLVRTLADAVVAIVRQRNRAQALLLSELGEKIAGPKHAPAGVKRLANLVHCDKWQDKDIKGYLLEEEGQLLMLEEAGLVSEGRALCILDGSEQEKPESTKLEGLSPVRSTKARRLARPRPKMGKGYYRGKPGPPIVVPGYEWISALITGWASREERRPVALAAWHWYAKPVKAAAAPAAKAGEVPPIAEATAVSAPASAVAASEITAVSETAAMVVVRQRGQEAAKAVLDEVTAVLGKDKLLHVWDSGFSGAPWLGQAMDDGLAFVVRWKKGNKLRPAEGPFDRGPDGQQLPAGPGRGARLEADQDEELGEPAVGQSPSPG